MISFLLGLLESVVYGQKLVDDRHRMSAFIFRAQLRGYPATGRVSWGSVSFTVHLDEIKKPRELPLYVCFTTKVEGPSCPQIWRNIEQLVEELPDLNEDDQERHE